MRKNFYISGSMPFISIEDNLYYQDNKTSDKTIRDVMKKSKVNLDLITVGRAGVDLYGQQFGARLEDVSTFAKYVGGCPANIAIGAARLGLRSGMITRVGDDHMGRFILEQFVREGVDTAYVITDPDRLTALAILGIRDKERYPLIFYRENCADMALEADDIDGDYIAGSRAVVLTGTHLSTEKTAVANEKILRFARNAGVKVVFDIDYRPVLWGLTRHDAGEERYVEDARVTHTLQKVIPVCDIIVGTEEEFHILGGEGNTLNALRKIRERTDAILVCKFGENGSIAVAGPVPETMNACPGYPGYTVKVLNVLGAGDAFLSGFIKGWLGNKSLEVCCQYGNACGALTVARHGCSVAIPSEKELEIFLDGRSTDKLEHVHWSTTRTKSYETLMVLAIDHRIQFEDISRNTGAGFDRIAAFKSLAVRAIMSIGHDNNVNYGVLLDDTYGKECLNEIIEDDLWIGCPIEQAGKIPLEFEHGPDVGSTLKSWPSSYVVKCLIYYHPDDEISLRQRQEEKLAALYHACRNTGHELLLEVICSKDKAVDANMTADVIERIYQLGIYPDWWKLEPNESTQYWQRLCDVINREDPFCRGIVLLGQNAPKSELIKSFHIAKKFALIKGFAIGRTIFDAIAKKWFAGELADVDVVTELRTEFLSLCDAWLNNCS